MCGKYCRSLPNSFLNISHISTQSYRLLLQKFPSEMQIPSTHEYVQASVTRMISQLAGFVNKEGHSSFQRATNDVLDIIGGLMRVINYAVYDNVTAAEIANIFPNGMDVRKVRIILPI